MKNYLLSLILVLSFFNSFAQNQSISFDGIDDHIMMGDILNDLQIPFTVSMWVYWEGQPDYGEYGIISSDNRLQFFYEGFRLAVDENGGILMRLGDGGIAAPYNRRDKSTAPNTVPLNQWAHVAIVVRGLTDMGIYLDGEEIQGTYAGSGGNMVHTNNPLVIGRWTYNQSSAEDWFFNGKIDEVRIWNTARTQTQIQDKMNVTLDPSYFSTLDSGLVAYWRLDQIEDLGVNNDGMDDVRDLSIFKNHGDIVGNPTSDSGSPFLSNNGVFSIYPGKGGNTGTISVSIYGSGFEEGATVQLSKNGDVVNGESVNVIGEGSIINTYFEFNGQALGGWDVKIINPNGMEFVLEDGFLIEEVEAPHPWVDIIGRDVIRVGVEQRFTILFGNRGNVDAVGVPLWIGGIPTNTNIELGINIEPPSLPSGTDPINWDEVPIFFESNNENILPLLIPFIPPNVTGALEVRLTISAGSEPFDLKTWVNPPYFGSPLRDDVVACNRALISEAIGLIPGADCVTTLVEYINQVYTQVVERGRNETFGNLVFSLSQLYVGFARVVLQCSGEFVPILQIVEIVHDVLGKIDLIDKCLSVIQETFGATLSITPVAAIDPNEKIGSRDELGNSFISGDEPLRYIIYFENLDSASAPAQEVIIRDTLKTEFLDIQSFSFGSITFGKNEHIFPPPGIVEFRRDVDLRPENDLILRIHSKFIQESGLIQWTFQSIDPITGEFTDDPLAGFLPPNMNPPEGEGSVLFTVMPKAGLSTGTNISNKAEIVFDKNLSIATPIWSNIIDNDSPSSEVRSLPQTIDSTSFIIEWSGSDVGAGILDYSIYVSENGGDFKPWLVNTREQLDTFTTDSRKSFSFYSIARDAVGNLEAKPAFPDATINAGIKPISYSLHQNYPNPVSLSTTIEYELPEDTHVQIVIYDALGREIGILVNEKKLSGHYEVEWNAQEKASGIYFYRIITGEFDKTLSFFKL